MDRYSADEQLVAELHRLGVMYLARFTVCPAPDMPPAALIAALARHPLSRFRAALILLFLRQPRYSHHLAEALPQLTPQEQATLKLYYQASVYLQREVEPVLSDHLGSMPALPDLFSVELGTPHASEVRSRQRSAQAALLQLGSVHAALTGVNCRWAGYYRQNIPLFLRQLSRNPHERQCQYPSDFLIFGGSALMLLGGPRNTLDVDYTLGVEPAQLAELRVLIQKVAAEMQMGCEESIPADFMPLPPGAQTRRLLIGRFGKLTAYILIPIALRCRSSKGDLSPTWMTCSS
jgi:hypothetical protein